MKTKQEILKESFDLQSEKFGTDPMTDEEFAETIADQVLWVPYAYCMEEQGRQCVLQDRESIIAALDLTDEQALLIRALEVRV